MQKHNSPRTNSGELDPRDSAILRHARLYGLTFPHPVQRLFFPAAEFGGQQKALQRAGNALHGLASAKLLTSTSKKKPLQFNKDYRYWILEQQGAAHIGVATPIKPPAEPSKSLAILWACTMGKKRFHLLDHKEFAELFDGKSTHHNVAHAIAEQVDESGKPSPVIYRLCRTLAEPKQVVRQARGYFEKALQIETLKPLVEVGDYAFAILVPTESRRTEVQKLLGNADGKNTPLNRLARFTVRLGPTTETLREAIKGLKSEAVS